MNPHPIRRRGWRVPALLILILCALSLAPQTALAQPIVRGDTLASGEIVENDVVMFGDTVRLAGTVRGNAFITGRDIVVDGAVEGSLFAIGQRVTINGAVDGSVYVIALASRLGETGTIGQNFYFVGVSLTTARGSEIGRDLNGLSLGAILQGAVGRDTRLIAGLVQFLDLFFDIALGPAPEALQVAGSGITGRAPGFGQFILPGEIVVDVIGRTEQPAQAAQVAPTQGEQVADWFVDRLREFLPLLIVGLLGYWFLRRPLNSSAAALKQSPIRALGLGLIGIILAGAIIGAFILVFVLVLVTGIWIGTATFWNVAWLVWSVAFPLTGLVFGLFLIFLNQGTKVITTVAAMTFAADRFAPRAARYRWLLLILGLVVYVFLRAIPILGWVISVLVTAWGIGAAWLAWRGRPPATLPATAPPPVEVTPLEAETTEIA